MSYIVNYNSNNILENKYYDISGYVIIKSVITLFKQWHAIQGSNNGPIITHHWPQATELGYDSTENGVQLVDQGVLVYQLNNSTDI